GPEAIVVAAERFEHALARHSTRRLLERLERLVELQDVFWLETSGQLGHLVVDNFLGPDPFKSRPQRLYERTRAFGRSSLFCIENPSNVNISKEPSLTTIRKFWVSLQRSSNKPTLQKI